MRTKMLFIASVAVGGCSFSSNSAPADSKGIDSRIDSSIDSMFDAPPDGPNLDFGPSPYTVHLTQPPSAAVQLPPTIDTDTSNLCSANANWVSNTQPAACFVVGTAITSGAGTTAATGSKPLVLVSTSTITLSKAIDASSKRNNAVLGAGGNYNVCDAFPSAPGSDAAGGGGGAGGSFLTQGGTGAGGNNNAAAGGGAPNAVATPTILRGGCAGQKGGNGNAGLAGNGGGAVYLLAVTSITMTVGIGVNGAGGNHGGHATGGSGGGSGGMIVLYAPTITATGATLTANGGGASSGGDNNTNGQDGSDVSMVMTAAQGGQGPGGDGGNGGILTTRGGGGTSGSSNQGGGGGGGGVGYIRTNVIPTGAITSPAVDIVP